MFLIELWTSFCSHSERERERERKKVSSGTLSSLFSTCHSPGSALKAAQSPSAAFSVLGEQKCTSRWFNPPQGPQTNSCLTPLQYEFHKQKAGVLARWVRVCCDTLLSHFHKRKVSYQHFVLQPGGRYGIVGRVPLWHDYFWVHWQQDDRYTFCKLFVRLLLEILSCYSTWNWAATCSIKHAGDCIMLKYSYAWYTSNSKRICHLQNHR